MCVVFRFKKNKNKKSTKNLLKLENLGKAGIGSVLNTSVNNKQPKQIIKKMVSHSLLSMLMVFTCLPAVFLKSICVRPASPSSLYEISENGGDIAKLVKQVSTEVTSEFMISILSSGVGHSALLCEQDEWDRMAADYHHCVHQVQHQLRCGGHGGVCQWVQAFVDSCTGQVMGQCWTQQAIELLKKRQQRHLQTVS